MERDIDQLLLQLESLRKKQGEFAQEIDRLQAAIDALRSQSKGDPQITPSAAVPGWSSPKPIRRSAATHSDEPLLNFAPLETKWDDAQRTPAAEEVTGRSNLEKYIGENILSKLGIAITVIGVAVGAKYAIDHDMVTPLGRLIGGYSFGVVLSVMAWRLKMKYENFSAVLLSGAMAIFYFITYLGCTQYGLIPVVPAFALMVLFTIAAVMSSLLYNRQVIAHFGLVGAYAVPFLLSTKSSNVEVLFTYMALINTGILFIALKKQWISLNVSAFIFTWSIYFFWLNLEFYRDKFLWTALGFSTLFVLFFYAMFLVDKWKRKATNNVYDTIVIVINSGVFYLFGLYAIGDSDSNRHLLSSFHLFNAGIQWGLYRLLARRQEPAADIYPGLSVLFVAIAVPIEFDGYMVTLLWTIMSGLLFFTGRRYRMFSVELLSYPMLLVSFVSLLHDLQLAASAYFPSDPSSRVSIFLHKEFYVALFYVFAVFFITYYHSKQWRWKETEQGNQAVFTLLLSSLGTLALYVTFRAEIVIYWNQLFDDSMQVSQLESPDRHYGDRNLMHFRLLWTTIFTLFFAGAASLVNAWWFAGRTQAIVLMVFGFLGISFFLFQGLMSLGALRSAWIGATPDDMFPVSDMFIGIRYVGWAALLFLLWAMRFAYRRLSVNTNMGYVLEAITHLSFLVMGSNEIVHWMDVAGSGNGEKMGVSVYWGLYALLLIVMGIRTGKQYQRIAALVIFGAALLKLFFYDLSHLDTISKTITLVVLGILLLLVSFLYYKFRNKLSE